MWNQKRPPWYQAILDLVGPILSPIAKTVTHAAQTGASIYQAMSLVVACFAQLWDCVDPVLPRIASLIQDILPVDVIPLHRSALLQILISALYTEFITRSATEKKKAVKFLNDQTAEEENVVNQIQDTKGGSKKSYSFDGDGQCVESLSLALAEALCSIDEDNKHTEQIDEFLDQTKGDVECVSTLEEQNSAQLEILASDLLMSYYGKSSLKVLFHFIKHNKEWLYQNLGSSSESTEYAPNRAVSRPNPLSHTMFHIGDRPFDQVRFLVWEYSIECF